MRVLLVAWVVACCGCVTTTSVSQRTLFTTTPNVPQGFAGATGVNLTGHALLGVPKEARDNSTAYAFLQFEGGGLLRLPDQRTSLGARFNLASAGTGVSQPAGRLKVPSSAAAGGFELQAAHDIPLHEHVGLTMALQAGLVFSQLLVAASAGLGHLDSVEVAPNLAGGFGVYGSIGGFRPFVAVTVGTQVLNSATGVITCTAGVCEDTGTVRVGALITASAGARFSWGSGAVEVGVLVPLTQLSQRLPVSLGFTVYLGDLALKPPRKPAPVVPPPVQPPLPPPPPPPPEYAPL